MIKRLLLDIEYNVNFLLLFQASQNLSVGFHVDVLKTTKFFSHRTCMKRML